MVYKKNMFFFHFNIIIKKNKLLTFYDVNEDIAFLPLKQPLKQQIIFSFSVLVISDCPSSNSLLLSLSVPLLLLENSRIPEMFISLHQY